MKTGLPVWAALRGSFWFTPALIVLVSMAAAAVLVEVDVWKSVDLAQWSPRLFGAGAAGSREMLSAIATSMITVAGVVFSITIVTLSLTSTQYSPRVLRNFMRDAPTQVVLGVFVGAFAYCLVVLRTIRGGDEGAFIPSLGVLGGMAYAFVGIGVLIYFIHHVALAIQASSILARITRDTEAAIDHLFPQELGQPPEDPSTPAELPQEWQEVPSPRSGYITAVDNDKLLLLARESGKVLRIAQPVGAFVAEGSCLLAVSGSEPVAKEQQQRLCEAVMVGSHRTVEQDAAFGLQQLVDVALRSLSPGINDPTTACMSIDQLGALLARLARRRIPARTRYEEGQLRVIAPSPDFGALIGMAFDPVVRHSRGDLQVLECVLQALRTVATATDGPRKNCLLPRLQEVRMELAGVRPGRRAAPLRRRLTALERELRHPGHR